MAKPVVVVLSGGLDSLVVLSIVKESLPASTEIYVFRADIGSRQSAKEAAAFNLISDFYGIPEDHRCQANLHMPSWMGNDLFDPYIISVEPGHTSKEFFQDDKSKSTIGDNCNKILVPIRNAVLLSMTFSYALSVEADSLWLGYDYVSSPGKWWDNAPPDKHPEFVSLMEQALNKGSGKKAIKLVTPLQGKAKPEIVKIGNKLNSPFELSWSCYNGMSLSCGVCPACKIRLNGFKANKLKDPLTYHKKSEVLKYFNNPIP